MSCEPTRNGKVYTGPLPLELAIREVIRKYQSDKILSGNRELMIADLLAVIPSPKREDVYSILIALED